MTGLFLPLQNLWGRFKRGYRGTNLFRLLLMSVVVGIQARMAGLSLSAPSGEELFTTHGGTLCLWVLPTATTLVGLLNGWLPLKFIPDSQQDRVTYGVVQDQDPNNPIGMLRRRNSSPSPTSRWKNWAQRSPPVPGRHTPTRNLLL